VSGARPVVTVVAVVALAAATVKVIRARDRHKEVMRAVYSDLHNIAVAQEAYFTDNGSYGMDVSLNGGRPMHGSTVRIVRADATSWEATATHPGTSMTCTSTKVRKDNWGPPVCK
jgi:hypothetical protein